VRKLFSAALAASVLSLGALAASASPSPIYTDIANTLAYSGTANLKADADAPRAGAELAGLVIARSRGVTGLDSAINTLVTNTVATYGFDPDLAGTPPAPNYHYSTDQVYGLALAGSTEAASYLNYYTANGGDAANANAYAGGGGTAATADTAGVFAISHLLLSANLVGTGSQITNYQAATLAAIQNIVGGSFDTNTRAANNDVSPIEALAVGLYALKLSGSNAGNAYIQLLRDAITNGGTELYQQILTANHSGQTGYSEDTAYGILALQAYGYYADAQGLIDGLYAAVVSVGQVPQFVGGGTNEQYAGAALQALPEPTTAAVLGLMSMALMGRRRRQA